MSAPRGWWAGASGEAAASARSYDPSSKPRYEVGPGTNSRIRSPSSVSGPETMSVLAPQSRTMYAASSAVRWWLTTVR